MKAVYTILMWIFIKKEMSWSVDILNSIYAFAWTAGYQYFYYSRSTDFGLEEVNNLAYYLGIKQTTKLFMWLLFIQNQYLRIFTVLGT